MPQINISNTTALQVILFVTAAAAVFVEVAKRRTLRDIKLAANAMPYTLQDILR
jgi:hypothetical protein